MPGARAIFPRNRVPSRWWEFEGIRLKLRRAVGRCLRVDESRQTVGAQSIVTTVR
jgi:hypothetical protein